MTVDIYILTYNNYFNRDVKWEDSLEEYLAKDTGYLAESEIGNFKVGDGINTTQVFNQAEDDDSEKKDYCIVVDSDTGKIHSRWFITETGYNRYNQYTLTLRRDILVDFYPYYKDAPCRIERAMLLRNDPAIYNKEGIQVNQIKKSEELLWDKTGWAWIVGYIDKKTESKTIDYQVTLAVDPTYEYDTWEEFVAAYPATITEAVDVKLKYRIRGTYIATVAKTVTYNSNGLLNTGEQSLVPTEGTLVFGSGIGAGKVLADVPNYVKYDSYTQYIPTFTGTSSSADVASWENINNQYVRVKGGSKAGVYLVSTSSSTSSEKAKNVITSSGTIYTTMVAQSGELKAAYNLGGDPGNGSMAVLYKERVHTFKAIKQTDASKQLIIPADHPHTNNATYDVFCIPYCPGKQLALYNASGLQEAFSMSSESTLTLASEIAIQMGASLYDLQILPYCPILSFIKGVPTSEPKLVLPDPRYYTQSKKGETVLTEGIFWVPDITVVNTLNYSVQVPTDPIEAKVFNECTKYRLCAPNGNGAFDFSPLLNEGVSKFNVFMTLKPYQPFIRIAPDFGGLYGEEFKDYRGLILSGDYSVPRNNDAWIQYIQNNKNYLLTFNRQIQNMEFNQQQARREAFFNMLTGSVSAAGTGAILGSALGPAGMAFGAGMAGTVSRGAGLADAVIMNKKFAEETSMTRDNFMYSTGNIAARPDTIASVGSFTNSNKLAPYIEVYDCTDIEKDAFREFLKYNGMMVGRIATVSEFAGNNYFVKGSIIKMPLIESDSHAADVIYSEVMRGGYYERSR